MARQKTSSNERLENSKLTKHDHHAELIRSSSNEGERERERERQTELKKSIYICSDSIRRRFFSVGRRWGGWSEEIGINDNVKLILDDRQFKMMEKVEHRMHDETAARC